MKAQQLKLILSALGFFALTSVFAQVDSTQSPTGTTNSDAQTGTMTIDSTTSDANPNVSEDNSTMDSNTSGTSDSSSVQYNSATKPKKAKKR